MLVCWEKTLPVVCALSVVWLGSKVFLSVKGGFSWLVVCLSHIRYFFLFLTVFHFCGWVSCLQLCFGNLGVLLPSWVFGYGSSFWLSLEFFFFVWFRPKLIFSCLVLLCAGLQAVFVIGECFPFVPSRVLER